MRLCTNEFPGTGNRLSYSPFIRLSLDRSSELPIVASRIFTKGSEPRTREGVRPSLVATTRPNSLIRREFRHMHFQMRGKSRWRILPFMALGRFGSVLDAALASRAWAAKRARERLRSWTTKEARLVLEWSRRPSGEKPSIDEVATQLGRSSAAVQQFLRRALPRGQRPWDERPRWTPAEIEAVQNDARTLPTRSRAAVKKYVNRHCRPTTPDCLPDDELERSSLTVTQVAADLGLSRASVYRLLKSGVLRRFKGGVAETSFSDLLREHPEVVPYSRLPRDCKEWLVLNGYNHRWPSNDRALGASWTRAGSPPAQPGLKKERSSDIVSLEFCSGKK